MPAAPFEDFYATLGVARDAAPEAISRAYRKLSLSVHPDRYKGPDPDAAIAEFHRLTKAREVLEDEKAKAAFDALLRAKEAHRARQDAQDAGRKKMRSDLEAREAAAARSAGGGGGGGGRSVHASEAAEAAAEEAQQEARARAELQREIERLRQTGRLSGQEAAARHKPKPAGAAAGAAASSGTASAASAGRVTLSLRWSDSIAFDADRLGALLREIASPLDLPRELTLAIVGGRAVLELPREHARRLMAQGELLATKGVRVSCPSGAIGAGGGSGEGGGDGEGAAAGTASEAAAAAPLNPEPPLPPGWKLLRNGSGRPYYYEVSTTLPPYPPLPPPPSLSPPGRRSHRSRRSVSSSNA